MKTIRKTIPIPDDLYIKHYFSETCAFFDIETTGFSAKTAFVYLIGIALRQGDSLCIYQFLAENRREESELLTAFHKHLESVDTLISFNGLGFDIPFLKSREQADGLCFNWNSHQNIDLYKLTGKLAHLFHLPNKKQKSVEQFLGIDRDDKYNGGELIPIYYAYEKQQTPELEHLLLLHNYEDVLGMTKLLSLLSYRDFLEGDTSVSYVSLQNHTPYNSDAEVSELLLTLQAPLPFPQKFLFQSGLCSLRCQDDSAKLLIPVFTGELKFYYDNYKDYYYLPEEDMAIHKSVAAFVDASHRKKATTATCYTKKSGRFLPQAEQLYSPAFYHEKKSTLSYFEMTEDFLSNAAALNAYAAHLLDFCLKTKRPSVFDISTS